MQQGSCRRVGGCGSLTTCRRNDTRQALNERAFFSPACFFFFSFYSTRTFSHVATGCGFFMTQPDVFSYTFCTMWQLTCDTLLLLLYDKHSNFTLVQFLHGTRPFEGCACHYNDPGSPELMVVGVWVICRGVGVRSDGVWWITPPPFTQTTSCH